MTINQSINQSWATRKWPSIFQEPVLGEVLNGMNWMLGDVGVRRKVQKPARKEGKEVGLACKPKAFAIDESI